MTTNEHALKAAQAIVNEQCIRTSDGVYIAALFTSPRLAEIITRTALEPAMKELREALQGVLNCLSVQQAEPRCIAVFRGLYKAVPKADAVLAKYPAEESDV